MESERSVKRTGKMRRGGLRWEDMVVWGGEVRICECRWVFLSM